MTVPSVTLTPVNVLILASLVEAPMHPYEIQRLAIEREKTSVMNVKRGSVYHAVQKLESAGLIEALETSRDGRRPERTVYRLTDEGREEVRDWLIDMLRRPKQETPQLVNALEFLPVLGPDEVASALTYRLVQLDREIGGLRSTFEAIGEALPRIFSLEGEFVLAMKTAERAWVAGVLDDLRSGALTWSYEAMKAWAESSPLAGQARIAPFPGEVPS